MRMSLQGSRMARIFQLLNKHRADEIISIIFMNFGSHRCIVVCSEVCKLWSMIANQDSVWKDLCIRLWADKAVVPDCFRVKHGALPVGRSVRRDSDASDASASDSASDSDAGTQTSCCSCVRARTRTHPRASARTRSCSRHGCARVAESHPAAKPGRAQAA